MSETPLFEIDDLHVRTVPEGNQAAVEILKGVSLTVGEGEVHALMGPNGSGQAHPRIDTHGQPRVRGHERPHPAPRR